jgi:RNA polymerase sigma-70 factor (ECF subfamily)
MEETESDEALMAAYVAGDRRAFERLFARMAPRVHGFFVRSFGDRALADELLQMTFLKLHQARATYRPDARVRPWLFAIAANVRGDELRRRYRRAEALDEDKLERADEAQALAQARDADAALDDTERAEAVRAALARLPESQRVVVVMHRYEGLTFGEIAKAVGASEGAVRVRAFRAYEALRVELKGLARAPSGAGAGDGAGARGTQGAR